MYICDPRRKPAELAGAQPAGAARNDGEVAMVNDGEMMCSMMVKWWWNDASADNYL